ncbi:MAG TPA: hypothetical protein VK929_17525 [Longimicrobiales bacterium]|nr:hypothetical protein [Longimicrobiales bacterium]
MKLDSLRDAWRHGDDEAPDASSAAALDAARQRAAALAADVRRRDRRETVVALLLIPVFLLFAFRAPTTLATVGALIVVVSCAFIPLRLRAARQAEPDPGLPVAAALREELERVRAQERLLGSVLVWYVGPLGLGLALYMAGGTESVAFRAGSLLVLAVLYAGIAWLNLHTARHNVRPIARALEQSIRELEGGDDA